MAEGRRVDDDTVSWQLVKLAKAHRALVGDALAKLGLHVGQDLLLEELWRQDGLTQSALIARLGVEPPTVTKTLQRLERVGLLRRERDPENARLWRVYLTDRGRATRARSKAATTASTFGQIDETEPVDRLVERFGRLAEEGIDLAIVELPDQGREAPWSAWPRWPSWCPGWPRRDAEHSGGWKSACRVDRGAV